MRYYTLLLMYSVYSGINIFSLLMCFIDTLHIMRIAPCICRLSRDFFPYNLFNIHNVFNPLDTLVRLRTFNKQINNSPHLTHKGGERRYG